MVRSRPASPVGLAVARRAFAAVTVFCAVTAAAQAWETLTPAASGPRAERDALARRLGCTAEASTESVEMTEAACTVGSVQYRIVTFAADDGRRQWLDLATDYGGTYLTGRNWVLAAWPTECLAPLRDRLGGALRTGAPHGTADGTDDRHAHGG
ncbi:hypothetical protein SAMN05216371_7785 [Streptomyces sp. TLI_053]|uniref:hypothetical protein n=1 Tax=Streptomyces sp. TLI_053 TaxID=1855352 RepID=UPI0008792CBB|nr:hypothetical protein [Streptomyces sp. TLI_053]SDT82973.1 hypothetical protein SAMN05216371_7785 [Streptomyces sp. TLI_053]